MIRIGAYKPGTSPQIDRALQLKPQVDRFLCQNIGEYASSAQTFGQIAELAARWRQGSQATIT